jgi:hypothetical protein
MTTHEEALAAYPALRSITALTKRGWSFRAAGIDTGGFLVGWFVWPHNWMDALTIADEGDVRADRCDPDGGVVWKRDGSLVDVVAALLELPSPDAPNAPRLVIGKGHSLWTP